MKNVDSYLWMFIINDIYCKKKAPFIGAF